MLFWENLFQFLALESQLPEPSQPTPVPAQLQEGLYFHQVTFTYPHNKHPALRDFATTALRQRISVLFQQPMQYPPKTLPWAI